MNQLNIDPDEVIRMAAALRSRAMETADDLGAHRARFLEAADAGWIGDSKNALKDLAERWHIQGRQMTQDVHDHAGRLETIADRFRDGETTAAGDFSTDA